MKPNLNKFYFGVKSIEQLFVAACIQWMPQSMYLSNSHEQMDKNCAGEFFSRNLKVYKKATFSHISLFFFPFINRIDNNIHMYPYQQQQQQQQGYNNDNSRFHPGDPGGFVMPTSLAPCYPQQQQQEVGFIYPPAADYYQNPPPMRAISPGSPGGFVLPPQVPQYQSLNNIYQPPSHPPPFPPRNSHRVSFAPPPYSAVSPPTYSDVSSSATTLSNNNNNNSRYGQRPGSMSRQESVLSSASSHHTLVSPPPSLGVATSDTIGMSAYNKTQSVAATAPPPLPSRHNTSRTLFGHQDHSRPHRRH